MKSLSMPLLLLLLTAAAADVTAADWKAVRGIYAVTANNYLDPSETEPKDSHLRLQLSGEAARELYRAMKVRESRDECTGAIAKKVGEMQCLFYRGEKRYACHFSIDIMRQMVEYGIAC